MNLGRCVHSEGHTAKCEGANISSEQASLISHAGMENGGLCLVETLARNSAKCVVVGHPSSSASDAYFLHMCVFWVFFVLLFTSVVLHEGLETARRPGEEARPSLTFWKGCVLWTQSSRKASHTWVPGADKRWVAGTLRRALGPDSTRQGMGDSRTDLGQKGFRSQDHTAGGKLGNPIGQPVVVQMGKLQPRVGKGFAQSHTESYAARTVVLLSDSWSRPISSTFHWPGRSLGWVFRSPTRSRGRRCKEHAGLCFKWCGVDQGG